MQAEFWREISERLRGRSYGDIGAAAIDGIVSVYSGTSVYVLNPFHILGSIPNRTYTKRNFPIRNKGKMINPFP
jgi:hypothetical protein